MWRYRLKLTAWWLWPYLLLGAVIYLTIMGVVSRTTGIVLNIGVMAFVLMLNPPKPRRPETKWWVQSRYSGRQWHDEAWSHDKWELEDYISTRHKLHNLKYRIVERPY